MGQGWMANYLLAKLVKIWVGNCFEIVGLFLPLFSNSAAFASGEAELDDFG